MHARQMLSQLSCITSPELDQIQRDSHFSPHMCCSQEFLRSLDIIKSSNIWVKHLCCSQPRVFHTHPFHPGASPFNVHRQDTTYRPCVLSDPWGMEESSSVLSPALYVRFPTMSHTVSEAVLSVGSQKNYSELKTPAFSKTKCKAAFPFIRFGIISFRPFFSLLRAFRL